MENKNTLYKTIKILILLALAIGSFFYLGNMFSKPETYGKIIEILDEKKASVLGLTATTSAASISITMIPDDIGTPVANQLADLSAYLLIILTVIYLEKYLLTIIGIATFRVILPLAFLLWIVFLLFPQNFSLKRVSIKLVTFGVALFMIIPVSVYVSEMIDNTYEESIKETLLLTNQDIKIEENSPKEDLPWYEQILHSFNNVIADVKDTISKSTSEAVNKVKTILNNFIEATAVMIVTSCVIPLLTIIVFIWLTKIILDVDIKEPDLKGLKNKIRHSNKFLSDNKQE